MRLNSAASMGAYDEILSRPPDLPSLQPFGPKIGGPLSMVLVADARARPRLIRTDHRERACDGAEGLTMIGCSFDAMEKVSSHFTEIAALPWRIGSEGTLEILLLHSPQDDIWAVPNEPYSRSATEVHAAESAAFRHAGVAGRVGAKRLGTYWRSRVVANGGYDHDSVCVFGLHVFGTLVSWPSETRVARRWMSLTEATALVADSGLADLLATVASRSSGQHPQEADRCGLNDGSRFAPSGVASAAQIGRFGAC